MHPLIPRRAATLFGRPRLAPRRKVEPRRADWTATVLRDWSQAIRDAAKEVAPR